MYAAAGYIDHGRYVENVNECKQKLYDETVIWRKKKWLEVTKIWSRVFFTRRNIFE